KKGGEDMASGSNSNTPVVVQARQALKRLRDEVANELNIDTSKIQGGYWGYLPARDAGAVGGHMVKRMIEAAERSLFEQSVAQVRAGFMQGFNAAAQGGTPGNQGNQQYNPGVGNYGKGY
ncbi:MAG: small, acid-soluble spore protein, alpha/beta type, partial [Bacteroidota bacterium]